MRESALLEAFAKGLPLYLGDGDASGELIFELTRRMSAETDPSRVGMEYGVNDFARGRGRGLGAEGGRDDSGRGFSEG